MKFFDDRGHCLINAALHRSWVRAGSDVLQAFGVDRLGVHGGSGGAVARVLRRLAGNFLHHLCAHVLVGILKLDLLGNSHAVLGDGGSAKGLLKNHHATRWSESDLDGLCEFLNAAENLLTCVYVVCNLLCCHGAFPLLTVCR